MTRCIVAMLAACAALTAHAQYPEKPVRVVVSTVPGPLDTFARMVLDKMSAALKQPFVVENKPGAGGNIAAEHGGQVAAGRLHAALRHRHDLHRQSVDLQDAAVRSGEGFRGHLGTGDLRPDARRASPRCPANSVAELVALSKQKKLTYASGGNGTPSHLSGAYFLATAGIDMTHVPYKGTGQSVIDVIAGQVDSIFAVTTGVLPHVQVRQAARARHLEQPSAPALLRPRCRPSPRSAIQDSRRRSPTRWWRRPARRRHGADAQSRDAQRALAQPDVQEKNRTFDYVATGLDPASRRRG